MALKTIVSLSSRRRPTATEVSECAVCATRRPSSLLLRREIEPSFFRARPPPAAPFVKYERITSSAAAVHFPFPFSVHTAKRRRWLALPKQLKCRKTFSETTASGGRRQLISQRGFPDYGNSQSQTATRPSTRAVHFLMVLILILVHFTLRAKLPFNFRAS